jgi:hypothetical protein
VCINSKSSSVNPVRLRTSCATTLRALSTASHNEADGSRRDYEGVPISPTTIRMAAQAGATIWFHLPIVDAKKLFSKIQKVIGHGVDFGLRSRHNAA